MTVPHFKRYRMERPLNRLPELPCVPAGFRLTAWDDRLLDVHADVLFRSFTEDLDGRVFPNLATVAGCRALVRVIRQINGFCQQASGMIAGPDGYAGVVEGIIDESGLGAIQNVGVTPDARGRGVGAALLVHALRGFYQAGVRWCHLEVTAENEPAFRLYQRFGFRKTRVTYKPAVDPAPIDTGV
jgi:ribosomal protein S18 acetylase RimI-like enzyme